jgi:DNA-binding NarL/FixJ family response regulator
VIRVVVADDQALVRAGFRMILETAHDMEVVAEAEDGHDALGLIRTLEPDVALMDIRMPNVDGIVATRRVVESGSKTRVLMLTTFDLDEYVYRAMRAGASGFLLKTVPPAQLIHAVRMVFEGDTLLAPAVTRRLVEAFVARPMPGQSTPDELRGLTGRELDVLRLVASGLSNAEIAGKLFVSDATVKTHINRILAKLQLRDRVQAVVYSYETGLVEPGSGQPSG